MKSYTKHMQRAKHYCADAAGTLELIEMLLEEGPEKWSDPALWVRQLKTNLHYVKVYSNLANKEAKKAERSCGGAFSQNHGLYWGGGYRSWGAINTVMHAIEAQGNAKKYADTASRLIEEKMMSLILKDPRSAMAVGQAIADELTNAIQTKQREYQPNPLLMPKDLT